MVLGELMIKCTVIPLHLKHPFQFVARFIQDIGNTVTGFGDIKFTGASLFAKDICVEQVGYRDCTGAYVFSIVSGIVLSSRDQLPD